MPMTPRRAATVVVVAAALAGCRSCQSSDAVGVMATHKGDVKRDSSSAPQKWSPAEDGAKLGIGDGLKTGSDSEALVRLSNGGKIALTSDTTIRFSKNAKGTGKSGVAVETGEANIEADDNKPITVETTIGVAHIEAGGRLRVSSAGGGTTRVEVTLGAARLDTEDGGAVVLAVGRPVEVALGGAIVEKDVTDGGATATNEKKDAAALEAPPPSDGSASIVVSGPGVRVQSKGTNGWQAVAASGSAVPIKAGDTVDVPAGGSVEVRRGAQRGRVQGAGKFVVANEGGALVKASSGRVEIEATSEDVTVEVPGGTIVAKSGEGKSRVDADLKGTETKVSVRQGRAEVRGSSASATMENLRAGEGITLSTKGTVASQRQPDKADFTIRAGDSFMIRDPKPPTALGFDFSAACPGAGVVSRSDGASARGDKRAILFLPAGHQEYSVRCIGPDGVDTNVAVSGAITVVADAARAEFSRLPPATVVDMDGRRYTVLYQNLLPSVIARWQDAPPSSGGYTLHIDKDKTKGPTAKQSLKSGAIAEGTHTIWYETDDGKKSPETTLVIKFDNAAPTASVREPIDGSFAPGDTVKVSGVVVEGWSVSVNGTAVPLDEQKRFSTTTTAPAGERENAVVLRITNPKRGTVYYVRHASTGTR